MTGSTSPSCATGGTHSTRIENYQRIKLDGSTWKVWDKLGVLRTYSPVQSGYQGVCAAETYIAESDYAINCVTLTCAPGWTAGVPTCVPHWDNDAMQYYYTIAQPCTRTPTSCASPTLGSALGTLVWGLTKVTDTHANNVTYAWSCSGSPARHCYPSSVSYNGTAVTLYWESRSDDVTTANGTAYSSFIGSRLKTITVSTSATPVRAYAVRYTTTPSGRSAVSSIQQYGNDYVLDTSTKAITGGTALPAMSLTYGGATVSYPSLSSPTPFTPFADSQGWGTEAHFTTIRYADINGDGAADVCGRSTAGIGCYLSSKNGSFSSTRIAGPAWASPGFDADAYNDTISYADVNGDGKADVCARLSTGISCYLSNGSGFPTAFAGPAWSDAAFWNSTSRYQTIRYGDINGDGKADICGFNGTALECHLSTGTAFSTSTITGPGSAVMRFPTTVGLADVNGDGKADACGRTTGGLECFLSTGSGFGAQVNGPLWSGGFTDWKDRTIQYTDVNGDGKADICGASDSGYDCYLSDGLGVRTLFGRVSEVVVSNGWSADQYASTLHMVDVNADDRADVCGRDGNGMKCWLANASGFGATAVTLTSWPDSGGWNAPEYYGTIAFSDISGDGVVDLCAHVPSGLICGKNAAKSDLVNTVANGVGGTTTVVFKPSSSWGNNYLPLGFVLPTTNSLTTSDGHGGSSTTTYTYAGGLWSDAERRFLGFRKVKAVISAAGDYTETYYHQHVGCISKPETTYVRDALANIYSYSTFSYTENTAAPYTSVLTTQYDYDCALTTTCRKVQTSFAYDSYGNVTKTTEYGDTSLSTDNRATERGYVPNTTAYIVAKPSFEKHTDSAGTIVSQKLIYYDNATSSSTAPTKGDATTVKQWNNVTDGYISLGTGFDSYGNVTSTTDAAGKTKTYFYDDTYHRLLTKQCNELNQCTKQTWKVAVDQVETSESPNSVKTTFSYDPIGRMTSLARADGAAVTYSYLTVTDAQTSASLAKIRRSITDGTTDGLWLDTYLDGLGRAYLTVAESGARQDFIFSDGSERPAKKSLPYFSSQTPQFMTYLYDALGRLVRVTNPDNTFSTMSYGVGVTVATDELTHARTTWTDAFGRTTQVQQVNSDATTFSAFYEYDSLDHLVKITDTKGNTSTTTYDSLGNRIAECDWDLGCSTAEYNSRGLPTDFTDAKGQTRAFEYDAAGRVTKRTLGTEVTTFTYDEARLTHQVRRYVVQDAVVHLRHRRPREDHEVPRRRSRHVVVRGRRHALDLVELPVVGHLRRRRAAVDRDVPQRHERNVHLQRQTRLAHERERQEGHLDALRRHLHLRRRREREDGGLAHRLRHQLHLRVRRAQPAHVGHRSPDPVVEVRQPGQHDVQLRVGELRVRRPEARPRGHQGRVDDVHVRRQRQPADRRRPHLHVERREPAHQHRHEHRDDEVRVRLGV